MFKESVEFNLANLAPEFGCPTVTGSAFTQARYKIKPDFFCELSKLVKTTYESSEKKCWNGHLLLAGDGSTINLPSSQEIKDEFGVYSEAKGGVKKSLARTLLLYDVLSDFIVESRLSKMKVGEKGLLMNCLKDLKIPDAVIILDRGFGHFCTIKELMNNGHKFCIRLPIDSSNFAKAAANGTQTDFMIEWKPSKKEKQNSTKNNLDHTSIMVRVVKVELKTGQTEVLVTNLDDQKRYSTESLAELYNLRWGVEEGFKKLKPKMKLEQFGARKTVGILQEYHAHIFLFNIVSLTGMIAGQQIKPKPGKSRKYQYKYNWQNAYRFVREDIVKLLSRKRIRKLLDELINKIAASIVAIIPNRSFARNMNKDPQRITQYYK